MTIPIKKRPQHPAHLTPVAFLPSDDPVDDGTGRHFHLLIVDDDDFIRDGLVSYLENYHQADYTLSIDVCASPAEGRELLRKRAYHLVISDINMPGEDGFAFIHHIHTSYPDVRTAMITAYQVEEYIFNAKKTGVFNIIAKTAPFDFQELSTVVNNLLDPTSAFGLETYMEASCEIHHGIIRSSADIMAVFQAFREFLEPHEHQVTQANNLLTAVIEALTNAVYHAAKLPDGALKYEKGTPIERLEETEYVDFRYGRDALRLGVSIADQGGRMTAEEILYWLDRNVSGSGLMDMHGRGVFMMHRLVDRVLINIAPAQRTEIILLSHFNSLVHPNKPIYINQMKSRVPH